MAHPIVSLAKRRGFYWPAFEIYQGVGGLYDLGPLGARLQQELVDLWRSTYVLPEGFLEVDTPTLGPEVLFRASGHLGEFADLLVCCRSCQEPFRADHLLEGVHPNPEALPAPEVDGLLVQHKVRCPRCGASSFDPARPFNLMFQSNFGPIPGRFAYLRPETAQGIFANFPALYRLHRKRLPFGVAQVGRAYRNEISPRQGLLRLREFGQMEVEYFHGPTPADKDHPRFGEIAADLTSLVPAPAAGTPAAPVAVTFQQAVDRHIVAHRLIAYHLARVQQFLLRAGIPAERLRFRQHEADEMAHYALDCWDAEVLLEAGWVEVVGIADRGCFDLEQHQKASGISMEAERILAEPREEEVTEVIPNFATLGPSFKGKAKAIGEALRSLDHAVLAGPITLTLEGGEEVVIRSDHFSLSTRKERRTVEPFLPHVVEPSFGLSRILYCVLETCYQVEVSPSESDAEQGTSEPEDGEGSAAGGYVRLRLPPVIAPTKVGVFPLMDRDGLTELALQAERRAIAEGLSAFVDTSQSIGRRYARADEVGVPFCITIDYQTKEDGTVTLRHRDTRTQERHSIVDALLAVAAAVRKPVSFGRGT